MAWGTTPDYFGWLKSYVSNKVENTRVRNHFKSGKCFFCRRQFGKYDVPKQVLTASGVNRDACNSCASAMGVKNKRQLADARDRAAEQRRKAAEKERKRREKARAR